MTTTKRWQFITSITGYSGAGLVTAAGTDPQTITQAGGDELISANPGPVTGSGIAAFNLPDKVVGLKPTVHSSTVPSPYLIIHVNATNVNAVRIKYTLRDIDSSSSSVQQVALQYRLGDTGDFTNVPGGYVADATDPGATKTTLVDVVLPAEVNNQSQLQIRIITCDALAATDEWVGIDDIQVSGNRRPSIAFPGEPVAYTENGAAAILQPDATVTDREQVSFNGAVLNVTTTNATSDDRLEIQHQGDAAGEVGISGTTISYSGVAIGSFSGGQGTAPLVLTFNSSATRSAIEAVVRRVSLRVMGDNPDTTDRTIAMVLSDGAGGTSAPVQTTVQIVATNDAPTLALNGPLVQYIAGSSAVLVAPSGSIADVDATIVTNAVLTVAISNSQSGDLLEIRHQGSGSGEVGIAGSQVLYEGIPVGTVSTTAGLAITLNASATLTSIRQILRSITFRNTGASPVVGSRTITATLQEGDGTVSANATAQVSVVASPPKVSVADAATTEGATGTKVLSFPVTLSADPTTTVVVSYNTQDDTATALDGDYESKTGTITFVPGGALTQNIDIVAYGDAKFELHEQFNLVISQATNAVIDDGMAKGTIQNDDALPTLSMGNVTVSEGNSGDAELRFVLLLSNPSYQNISVSYATQDNTASATNGDYLSASGNLVFAAGETSKQISVFVRGDTFIESTEQLFLSVTSSGGTTNTTLQASGTILNDDQMEVVVVDAAAFTGGALNDSSPDGFRLLANATDLQLFYNGQLARTLPLANVAGVVVHGSSDSDQLTVDYSLGYWQVPGGITFDGNFHGASTTNADELRLVMDGNAPQLILSRVGTQGNGSVAVGPASIKILTDYTSVETLTFVDEAGLTVPAGYVVTLADTHEPNETIQTASELTLSQAYAAAIDGDTDYYHVTASVTGTLELAVTFVQIATIAGGAAGLPGSGDLEIELYDAEGDRVIPAAPFGTNDADDNERIRIPVVAGGSYYLRVYGSSNSAVNAYSVLATNTVAPTPTGLVLSAGGQTTNDSTPTILFHVNDQELQSDIAGVADGAIPIPFQDATQAAGYRIAVFAGNQWLGFASAGSASGEYTFTCPPLSEGANLLTARLEMIDPSTPQLSAFGPVSGPLPLTIDTLAPAVTFGDDGSTTDGLDASSDTGVSANSASFSDRVTADSTPTLFGNAEAGATIRVYADSDGDGSLTNADILIAESPATAGSAWQATSAIALADGQRRFFVTATDEAGNVGTGQPLDLVIDTQAPIVKSLFATNYPTFDLLAPLGKSPGITPLVNSLTLRVNDLPIRTAPFTTAGFDLAQAQATGMIQLTGQASGAVPIASLTFSYFASGESRVTAFFNNPLADDIYALTVSGLKDTAGNLAATKTFSCTIDSRPEVGVWNSSTVTVDMNGNRQSDAFSVGGDTRFTINSTGGSVFAGNFGLQPADIANGFDKLATYTPINGQFQFRIDVDGDGVADNDDTFPSVSGVTVLNINGAPVAGRFDNNDANGDEVGVFDGSRWYFDTNHNLVIDNTDRQLVTALRGQPVVGDFDGDGFDDLATFDGTYCYFDLTKGTARSWDGIVDWKIQGTTGTPGQKAVTADVDRDGVDDVGLWVPALTQGQTLGQWYFILSGGGVIVAAGRAVGDPTHRVVTDPSSKQPAFVFDEGQDITFPYGAVQGTPIAGNFMVPVVAQPGVAVGAYTNNAKPWDVDGDGIVTPSDVIVIINEFNTNGSRVLTSTMRGANGPYFDVSGDRTLNPLDALLVINYLNTFGAGEGETTPARFTADVVAEDGQGAFSNGTAYLLDPWFYDDHEDADQDDLFTLLAAGNENLD